MGQNSNRIINQEIRIRTGIANREIIWGLVVVIFAAVATILSSMFGLGLLSVWPILILTLIFVRNYELGLVCFVLSFAYQAPAVFAPRYGLSAYLRLDEVVFAALLLTWMLKYNVKDALRKYNSPLVKPLFFYVLIAFCSLLTRYRDISSTAFLNTATGLTGLGPLVFKLAEVVWGYTILTDAKISQRTRNNLFLCLPIVAAFAVTLSFLSSHGVLPKSILTESSYDPNAWSTRFCLYGNTSAWGVLLVSYLFIFLYSLIYFKSLYLRIPLLILLVLCIDSILISGTKTAFIGTGVGLFFLAFKSKDLIAVNRKIFFFTLIAVVLSAWSLNQFATESQRGNAFLNLKKAYISTGIKGFDKAYSSETSLGSRLDQWVRFGRAVKEEPILLMLGRGWQRRTMYETGVSLHNDLLTACHDLGILGVVFVIWIFSAMFTQFSLRKGTGLVLSDENKLLRLIAQSLVVVFILSSFTSSNLTLYPGIEVQFPFMVVIMAVIWTYLRRASSREI